MAHAKRFKVIRSGELTEPHHLRLVTIWCQYFSKNDTQEVEDGAKKECFAVTIS